MSPVGFCYKMAAAADVPPDKQKRGEKKKLKRRDSLVFRFVVGRMLVIV